MQTIGRYELVEKLGQGGMGVVYRAFDPLLQRVVAVKLIGVIEADQELRERFFREARAAGQLSHKNIITIYDLGEHEGQPFLAMEYLEGQDLQQRMTSPAPMSLTRKLELAIEIGEGLEYAHLHGVIHRDIKPANIFITNGGIAKILDFGLARLITSELTNSNMMMGTVNYMAPEQVRGERADHRSDIFSAGVVLYEVFGGRRAFDGDSFGATLYKILEEVPVPLEQLDPTLPPPLIAVVERSLEKTREGRYQHMGEMLRDLIAYRQHLLITNSPAFGSAAQIAHDAPTIAAPAGSHPPFAPATPRPSGTAPVVTAPATPASAPAPAPAAGSKRHMLLAAAVAIVALGTLVIWSTMGGGGAPETMNSGVEPSVPASSSPTPDDAEAQRVAQAVERGLESARGLLKAGQFDSAATAAGEVLAVAPTNADAKRIMDEAATRSRGRGAEEARKRMVSARGAAIASSAQTLAAPSFAEAQKAEREAVSLMDRGQSSEAMAKFWEASGLFRSAEIAANTEAAARRERARAQANPRARETASREPSTPAPAPTSQSQPAAPATVPAPTGLTLPPAAPIAPPIVPPAPPVQAQPKPKQEPPAAPREPDPPPEAAIADLLDRYKAALENQSVDALRRIWPGMSQSQESAMRSDFQHAKRIRVDILGPQISVRGNNATVTFVRRYQLDTVEGQQYRADTRTTMTVHRTGSTWVIDEIRFENAP